MQNYILDNEAQERRYESAIWTRDLPRAFPPPSYSQHLHFLERSTWFEGQEN